MPLYRWSQQQVAQMETTATPSGQRRAVLRAPEGGGVAELRAVQSSLERQGIAAFVAEDASGMTLVIPEVKTDDQLLAALRKGQHTHTEPTILQTPADKAEAAKKPKSFTEKHPMLLTSIFWDIGSASWIVSGIQRARHNPDGKFTKADMSEMMVGAVLTAGNLLLTAYGNDRSASPMLAFSDALEAHLKKQGIAIPHAAALNEASLKHSGVLGAIHDFLKEHVVSVLTLDKSLAGAMMAHAATKPSNFNGPKLAAGLIMCFSWLATFALDKPNKPPYEFKPQEPLAHPNGLQTLGAWFAENPRGRIAAPSATFNNLLKLWGSVDEAGRFKRAVVAAKQAVADAATPEAQQALQLAQRKQYDYVWNVIGYCSFLIGNAFFGKTGKAKTVPDFAAFEQDMLTVAANMLASVPENARNLAVDDTASYIASIKGVVEPKEAIARTIHEKMQHIVAHTAEIAPASLPIVR